MCYSLYVYWRQAQPNSSTGPQPEVQGQHGGQVVLFLWSTVINHLSSELILFYSTCVQKQIVFVRFDYQMNILSNDISSFV